MLTTSNGLAKHTKAQSKTGYCLFKLTEIWLKKILLCKYAVYSIENGIKLNQVLNRKGTNYWFSKNNRFGGRLLLSWGTRMCVGTDLYTNLPVCLYEKTMCSLEWRIKECFIKEGWVNLPLSTNIFLQAFSINLWAQKWALPFLFFSQYIDTCLIN